MGAGAAVRWVKAEGDELSVNHGKFEGVVIAARVWSSGKKA